MDNDQRGSPSQPPSISDALDRLLAHPELLSMVASAIGNPTASATPSVQTNEATAQDPIDNTHEDISANDATDSDILPASEEKIATPSIPPAGIAEMVNVFAPLLSGNISKSKINSLSKPDDDRACLLRALKPYVSRGRREAIDYMIRLSQISDILKHMH